MTEKTKKKERDKRYYKDKKYLEKTSLSHMGSKNAFFK